MPAEVRAAGLRQPAAQARALRRRLILARRRGVREAEGRPPRQAQGADREDEGEGRAGQLGVGDHRVEGGQVLGGGAAGPLGRRRDARGRDTRGDRPDPGEAGQEEAVLRLYL